MWKCNKIQQRNVEKELTKELWEIKKDKRMKKEEMIGNLAIDKDKKDTEGKSESQKNRSEREQTE